MDLFDGTAARQLDLVDAGNEPIDSRLRPTPPHPTMQVVRRDVYAELTRRRRRAQIAARHEVDKA